MSELKPEDGLIFRITHIRNVPWILDHGLHCRNAGERDPNFVEIGNPELIQRRSQRQVPIDPGGVLSDYIPFYFTPHSPMLLNIKTGFQGLAKRSMSEMIILLSSLPRLAEIGARFVFTDRHAYLRLATYFPTCRVWIASRGMRFATGSSNATQMIPISLSVIRPRPSRIGTCQYREF